MNRKLIAIIALSFLLVAFLSSAAFWVWLQAQYASRPAKSSAGSSMANAPGSVGRGSTGQRSADLESTEPGEHVEPSFHFFSKVDRKVLAANLAQLSAKFEQQPRPAGMEEDVYAMCDALLNDDTSMKQLCTLTVDKTGNVVDAGFTKDGEYFVTLGDKLIVWRAATGEKVREHAVPLAGAKTLLLQKDPSMAVLVSDTTLLKCSLVDGTVDGKREYKAGIKYAAIAYETGSIAICNGEMYAEYITSDLSESRVFDGAQLAAPQLAIAPNDRCIVFIHKQQPIRWLLKEKTSEMLTTHEIEVPKYTLVSGNKQDYMVSDGGMYGFREGRNVMPVPDRENPIAFHLILPIYQALPLNSGHMDTLLMVLGARPGEKPGLRVVDYHFILASKPIRICDGENAKVFTNRFGNRLAVQNATEIQLYHRRPWVSADGNMWQAQMLELFRDQRFKQLELAADYVRRHKRLPCNITGERAYSDLVDGIAPIWAGWEETKDNPECVKLYELAEQWKASKSTLALCASAARHKIIGTRARGTGFANTVSDEQWETFSERNQKALEDLSAIASDADLPAVSFQLTMFILQVEGGSHQAADRILEVYTVKYPYETLCHEIAALWSLERWGGARGQGNGYFEKLAELYPSEWSDIVYGRLASRFQLAVAELEPGEFCFNQSRAVNGLAAMLNLDWLPREEMERAIAYYNFAGAGDINSFVERHRAEYDVMSHMAYYHNIQHLFVPKQ